MKHVKEATNYFVSKQIISHPDFFVSDNAKDAAYYIDQILILIHIALYTGTMKPLAQSKKYSSNLHQCIVMELN